MIVTFKRNYDVQIYEEDKHMSGIFTFMCGKSYKAEYKNICGCKYLVIYDKDNIVKLMFNKFDEERYLL
jgi:hypothetical protein